MVVWPYKDHFEIEREQVIADGLDGTILLSMLLIDDCNCVEPYSSFALTGVAEMANVRPCFPVTVELFLCSLPIQFLSLLPGR